MNHPPERCLCGSPFPPDARPEGDVWRCERCGRETPLEAGSNPAAGPDTGQPTAVVTPPPVTLVGGPDAANGPAASVTGMPAKLGPYRLEREIGKGGMGTVYQARDEQLGREVAVKTLTSEYRDNQDFFVRFQREARAAALINHRNIVQIYYTGVENGIPFFGMEYVPGRNLEEILHDEGPLDPERVIDFMIQAAEGLRAAAARGVIHRDIKPTNLLVLPDGTVKIADFGLAKSLDFDSRLTMTGAVVGTPFYMSPEQGRGESVDHRSDIYALGASFYHLLCGEPPFQADSPVGIILKHINETPPPLRSRRPAVPPALATIIARMMAKSPANRYADYDELIAELAAARAGRTTTTAPASKRTRSKGAKTFVLVDAPPREIHLKRAGVIWWTLATAIDVGVLWGLALLSQIIRRVVLPAEIGFLRESALAVLACTLVYFTVLDARGGLTVGKAFFRLRLGDPDGEEIGLARSLIRFFLFLPVLVGGVGWNLEPIARKLLGLGLADPILQQIWFLCVVYGVLDLGYGFLPGERRALHDVLSSTFLFRQVRPRRAFEPVLPTSSSPERAAASTAARTPGPVRPLRPAGVSPGIPQPPPPPRGRPGSTTPRANRSGTGRYGNQPGRAAHRPAPRPSPSAAGLPSSPLRRVAPAPQTAAILGIVPGLGQVYNGQFFRGIFFFVGTIVFIGVGFGFLIWAWSIWHAYETARRQKTLYDRALHAPLPGPVTARRGSPY